MSRINWSFPLTSPFQPDSIISSSSVLKTLSIKLDVAFNIALVLRIPIQLLLPVQKETVDDVILRLQESIQLLEKLKPE